EGALRRLRREFRCGAAGRGGRARRTPAAAFLHRLRDAVALRGTRRGRRDCRRRDLVSARSRVAAARVFGGDAAPPPVKRATVTAEIAEIAEKIRVRFPVDDVRIVK